MMPEIAPVQILHEASNVPEPTDEPDPEAAQLPRGVRERQPDRTGGATFKIRLAGSPFYFIVAEYEDGRPCAVFIETGKVGSSVRGLYDTIGILLSHYLQLGGDPEVIAEKLRHIQFQPAGSVTGAPAGIEEASSPVDLLAQVLLAVTEESE